MDLLVANIISTCKVQKFLTDLFADNPKLCGAVDTLKGRNGIQRDLYRLIKFNKAKCKLLHLDQNSPKHKYRLGRERIERSPAEKDLGVVFDEKLNMSWQSVLTAQKPTVLGCLQSMASRLREQTALVQVHPAAEQKIAANSEFPKAG